jgi:acetylornithine deacetylase
VSHTDPTIALLEDLVAIDSVNPSIVSGAPGEAEIARRVAAECTMAGLAVSVDEIAPGRPNVVAVYDGHQPGPTLMFCGHLDTVGVTGMDQPFRPVQRDGRLYGRGAQDMKGGVAAMIGAARQIVEQNICTRGRLIVAAVVDEEHASIGAEALAEGWRADAAVVTEPTDLDIAVAHKGFEWVRLETLGRAAHGSRPRDGRDAILRMGRVLSRLEALDRRLQSQRPHPLLGTGSLHASIINGGRELSSYPERCSLQIERRTLPGEPVGAGLQEVRAILDRLRRADEDFICDASLVFSRAAYELAPSHPLPDMLTRAAQSVGCRPRQVGMSFWSDAAILSAAGVPTVLFGPGGAGLHSAEEYVRIDDVRACRDTLVALARAFLG